MTTAIKENEVALVPVLTCGHLKAAASQTIKAGNVLTLDADGNLVVGVADAHKAFVALKDLTTEAGETEEIAVGVKGIYNVVASGAINEGDPIVTAADGKVAAYSPVDQSTHTDETITNGIEEAAQIIGIAYTAAADNEKVTVEL